jgi:hypothetical protein
MMPNARRARDCERTACMKVCLRLARKLEPVHKEFA